MWIFLGNEEMQERADGEGKKREIPRTSLPINLNKEQNPENNLMCHPVPPSLLHASLIYREIIIIRSTREVSWCSEINGLLTLYDSVKRRT